MYSEMFAESVNITFDNKEFPIGLFKLNFYDEKSAIYVKMTRELVEDLLKEIQLNIGLWDNINRQDSSRKAIKT